MSGSTPAAAPLHPAMRPAPGAERSLDLDARRAEYAPFGAEVGGEPVPVAEVHDVETPGGVPCRWYRPGAAGAIGALVYFHGGGWVLGDLDGIDRVCRALANASGAGVLSVGYRLAPEHPFPAAVEDAEAAVRWMAGDGSRELGADGARLAVGGDSAGANLAAVVARRVRDPGGGAARDAGGPASPAVPALRLQALVYPVTDLTMASGSYADPGVAGLLDRAEMEWFRGAYLAGADPAHPDASPLLADDLSCLPPAFVATAGHDVLRDEGIAYARRLREAGVAVDEIHYPDMAHGFARWGGVLDAARELHARIGHAVRAALG